MPKYSRSLKCIYAMGFWLCSLTAATLLQSAAGQTVTLAWNASTNADVVGYKIYYGGSSGNYTNILSVGNVTTVTISNLVPGTAYYFAATACNSAGVESRFSNEAIYIPAPTLGSLRDLTVYENSSTRTVLVSGIGAGSRNQIQTLTVSAVTSNTNLISNLVVRYNSPNRAAQLSFRPGADLTGTATITVTVDNHNATNNITTKTFSVAVIPSPLSTSNTATQPTKTLTVGRRTLLASHLTVALHTRTLKINPNLILPSAASLNSVIHSNGTFTFTVNGTSGYQYVVQASTDMVNWVSLQTNTVPFLFTDPNAGQFNQRFYRAVSLP